MGLMRKSPRNAGHTKCRTRTARDAWRAAWKPQCRDTRRRKFLSRTLKHHFLLLICVLFNTAAGPAFSADSKSAKKSVDPPDVSKIYKRKCKRCHGAEGGGDGPAASKLKPRPTDWRKLDPITDRELFDIIWKGGKAVGKSKRMPAHRKKLTREEVTGLVRHVRALAASRR